MQEMRPIKVICGFQNKKMFKEKVTVYIFSDSTSVKNVLESQVDQVAMKTGLQPWHVVVLVICKYQ